MLNDHTQASFLPFCYALTIVSKTCEGSCLSSHPSPLGCTEQLSRLSIIPYRKAKIEVRPGSQGTSVPSPQGDPGRRHPRLIRWGGCRTTLTRAKSSPRNFWDGQSHKQADWPAKDIRRGTENKELGESFLIPTGLWEEPWRPSSRSKGGFCHKLAPPHAQKPQGNTLEALVSLL